MKKETLRNIGNGLIWIVVGIILDIAIQVSGMFANRGAASMLHVSKNSILPILLMLFFVAVFTTITVLVMLFAVRKKAPKTGFHPFRSEKIGWVGKGYLMILGAGAVSGLLQYVFTGGRVTATNQAALESMAKAGGASLLFVILLAVVVAPLVEELIFRGVVLNYFFKDGPWWLNVVLSGVLFGYFHVFQQFQFLPMIQYSLMGVALAVVYKKTKQIQYSMLTHMLNNSVAAISLISMALHH